MAKSDATDPQSRQTKIMSMVETFLDTLNEENGLRLAFRSGTMWVYQDGYWGVVDQELKEKLDSLLLAHCSREDIVFGKEFSPLWRTIQAYSTRLNLEFDRKPLIALANGTLDVKSRTLHDWDPKHATTRSLAQSWDPSAECPEWETMLARMLQDPSRSEEDVATVTSFLQEWVGVNVVGQWAKKDRRQLRQALIIEGPSSTGKSTFAAVVRELFGTSRVVAPDFSSLGSRFGTAVLLNAQALIGDDKLGEDTKANEGILKALVTGEEITADRKFMEPVTFRYKGAILFTANGLPDIKDPTDAIYGRFLVVRMTRVFTAADQQVHMGGMSPIEWLDRHGEWAGILNWALVGAERAMARGHFDLHGEILEAKHVFRMKNDPGFGFVQECVVPSKKTAIRYDVLAAVAQRYAMDNHGKKYALKKAGDGAVRAITEQLTRRGVEVENKHGTPYPDRVLGVGLSDYGQAIWLSVLEAPPSSLAGIRTAVERL